MTIVTSEKNRANGGKPSRVAIPATKGTASRGWRARRARTSAMVDVPSTAWMRPATTKRLAFASPCPSTWSSTAASASGPPTAAPIAMIPMCSTLE